MNPGTHLQSVLSTSAESRLGTPGRWQGAGKVQGPGKPRAISSAIMGDCDRVSSHNFMLISLCVDGAFIALSSVLRPIIGLIPRLSPIWLAPVDSQLPFMDTSWPFVFVGV